MPDWFYDALQAFSDHMNDVVEMNPLVGVLLITMGPPAQVLVHELGHALACLALGGRVDRLRVGGQPQLIVGRGPFRLELSLRESEKGEPAGFVEHSGELSLWRIAVIALAGPAVDMVTVVALALMAMETADGVGPALWLLAAGGVVGIVWNLVPHNWNDGTIALVALAGAVLRLEDDEPQPSSASIPPPAPAPVPAPPRGPAMRWPFAVLLGLVGLLTVMTGMFLTALALLVLFGWAFFQRTTRVS